MAEKKERIQTPCHEVQAAFFDRIERALDGDSVRRLEDHLNHCQRCARHWEAYRDVVEALWALEPLKVPDDLLVRIRTRLERPSPLRRLFQWIPAPPQRVFAPVVATACMLLAFLAVLQWAPWSTSIAPRPGMRQTDVAGAPPIEQIAAQVPWGPSRSGKILPGMDELMRPARALEEEQERRLGGEATLQDDLVLDVTGSEEVFGKIQDMLRRVRGKMFLVGLRHLSTGKVVRSRILLQVPLEKYSEVIRQIESLGRVHHLFLEGDEVPLPPDRLRIRILAKNISPTPGAGPLQDVSVGAPETESPGPAHP